MNIVPEVYWNLIHDAILKIMLNLLQLTEKLLPCQQLLEKNEFLISIFDLINRIDDKKHVI